MEREWESERDVTCYGTLGTCMDVTFFVRDWCHNFISFQSKFLTFSLCFYLKKKKHGMNISACACKRYIHPFDNDSMRKWDESEFGKLD